MAKMGSNGRIGQRVLLQCPRGKRFYERAKVRFLLFRRDVVHIEHPLWRKKKTIPKWVRKPGSSGRFQLFPAAVRGGCGTKRPFLTRRADGLRVGTRLFRMHKAKAMGMFFLGVLKTAVVYGPMRGD